MIKDWQKGNKGRTAEMRKLRDQGKTYREIGAAFRISHSRVKQLLDKEEKRGIVK